jgi:hypothetical protein
MNIRAGVAVVALSIFSSVALAQSLKDKEYFAVPRGRGYLHQRAVRHQSHGEV